MEDESNIDMEEEVSDAASKQSNDINELISIIDDGYKSEGELDTRKMVFEMNRKKKKSGGFQSMGLSYPVYKGVMNKGYKVPTPIQRKCIPLVMADKDVVAMARTGSGKTAAFLIPLFEKLQTRQNIAGARALLLAPTRELAIQTFKFVKELGRYTTLRTACILGGDKMDGQFSAIHENPDIIIATPGRLMHVLVEMEWKLKSVQYVVFDEADRLFELGFQEQLHEILRRLPDDRQTLLFSATLPKQLVEFAKAGLNDPTLVRLDVDSKLSDQLKIAFLHVRHEDKLGALLHLLRNVCKENEQSIVFVATKHHVEYIKEVLTLCGMKCSYVYSSLDQTARLINIGKFRNKNTMILIVTDVAARGLDIPMLDNVINFSFPSKSKLFVHRVGRVARAGRTGNAYSLVCSSELAYVIDLHLFLGRPLNFAKTDEKYQVWDTVYGSVPQHIVDEEQSSLQPILENSDIVGLSQVSENAFKQFLKSRPPAATESIKRAKELLKITKFGIHPLYDNCMDSGEKARLQLLSSMKDYKPTSTILEIGSTAKSTRAVTMKKTRTQNAKFVDKYKEKLKRKREKLQSQRSSNKIGTSAGVDETTDDVIQNTFRTIVQSTWSNDFVEKKKKKSKNRKQTLKDNEFYIEYKPKDHHSETGLTIGSSERNFAKEASNFTMDLIGDEDTQLRKHKMQQKVWDRKRKRFVNAQDHGSKIAKKKIRTESGAIISASYKKNIYAEWKRKTKLEEQESDHETDGISKTWRGGSRKRFGGKSGSKSNVKSELKRPEQILKQRKLDEQKMQRQQKHGKPKGKAAKKKNRR